MNSKNKYLIAYYLLLLVVFASWTQSVSVPGTFLRFAFMGAAMIPVLFVKPTYFPLVFLLFVNLAIYGYTSSYMPIMPYSHLGIMLVGSVLFYKREKRLPIPYVLLTMLVYCSSVDFILGGETTNISHALILSLLCFCFFNVEDNEVYIHIFSYLFILSSVVLTLHSFILSDQYSLSYGGYDGTAFRDINYSATFNSMGILAAFIEFFTRKKISVAEKAFLIISIVAIFVSLLMNASRNSVFSLAMGALVLLSFSKISKRNKIIFVILTGAVLIYLYNNAYFDMLEYRIMQDDGTGTHRTEIWALKFNLWSDGGVLQYLFGYGFTGGYLLGGERSFHNDFVAFLVDYGVTGLILLLLFLIYPLKHGGNNKVVVISILSFLMFTMCTLEPINTGRLPFYTIWLYAVCWANSLNANKSLSV